MSNKYLESVKEFHDIFGHPVSNNPKDMDLNLRRLRVKLLFEELKELSQALDVMGTFNQLCNESLNGSEDGDNVDIIETQDALCDIQYVLSGAVLALGFTDVNDKAFDMVHDSNMSKMCNDEDELLATIDYYNEQGVEVTYKEIEGKFLVYRKSDNKVLKNKFYKKVNLSELL